MVSEQWEGGYLEEAIDDANSHVHGLLQQAELDLDLNEPVDEDGPHVPRELLSLQVLGSDGLVSLGTEREERRDVPKSQVTGKARETMQRHVGFKHR